MSSELEQARKEIQDRWNADLHDVTAALRVLGRAYSKEIAIRTSLPITRVQKALKHIESTGEARSELVPGAAIGKQMSRRYYVLVDGPLAPPAEASHG